ncbi:pro-resilin-like [Portunus trituberculatus]|uniref:pro-resilin-like n=1 Tax=Portunus trituberculatus TaxID=210409 RepID=UPI001E1D170B|nr:pro-resilin-like [Portunus trituberculatus]
MTPRQPPSFLSPTLLDLQIACRGTTYISQPGRNHHTSSRLSEARKHRLGVMKIKAVVAVLSVVVATAAAASLPAPDAGYAYNGPAGGGGGGGGFGGSDGSSGPAQYNFKYDVDDQPSGNFFGHQEQRDGDRTEGSYYVRLPDSRLMRVEYYADDTGYHPTVTFEGEAQFPDGPAPGAGAGSGGAPGRSYSQPAPPGPAPAPGQSYSQPGPGTGPAPGPAPSQLYTAPGK